MGKKRRIDWEAIEREYRAGALSVLELERQFNVSDSAIHKRAKKYGWTRDLAARVRQKAEEKLAVEAAGGSGSGNIDAQEIVEKAAERAAEVVRIHRADVCSGREIVAALFSELRELNDPERLEEVEEAIIEETADDINKKRRHNMLRAVGLPSRAGVIRDLSQAIKNLIPLERQAFNLDGKEGDKPGDHVPIEERLKRYAADKAIEESQNVVRLRR